MSGSDFWSRRKAGVRAEAEAEAQAAERDARRAEAAAMEEKSDEEILAELNLPDPETIETGEEARRFLAAAVPERLRRRALRRLWRSNPVLANLDGLNDYEADFSTLGSLDDALQTTYQVGRGLARHVEALAEQEAAENARDEGESHDVSSAEEAREAAATPEPEVPAERDETAAGDVEITKVFTNFSDEEEFSPSRAKRMRYTFDS